MLELCTVVQSIANNAFDLWQVQIVGSLGAVTVTEPCGNDWPTSSKLTLCLPNKSHIMADPTTTNHPYNQYSWCFDTSSLSLTYKVLYCHTIKLFSFVYTRKVQQCVMWFWPSVRTRLTTEWSTTTWHPWRKTSSTPSSPGSSRPSCGFNTAGSWVLMIEPALMVAVQRDEEAPGKFCVLSGPSIPLPQVHSKEYPLTLFPQDQPKRGFPV